MNTDLTYASKEDFQTDAQIAAAKQNGEVDKINYSMASGIRSPIDNFTSILTYRLL